MKKATKSTLKMPLKLNRLNDVPVDFSDIPATTKRQWQNAVRGQFYRPLKRQLTIRVDADVLDWLKSEGSGYQSRLNEILRTAMPGKLQTRGVSSAGNTKRKR